MANRILVSDNLHQKGIDLFLAQDGFEVDVKTGLSPEGLKQIIGSYEGLVVRSATKVTSELLAGASNLKVIGRAGTGVDNIDIPEASRRGIVVMNTPGGNSQAAAEHTMSLIMASLRHIPQANHSMKEGKWEKKKFQGREIAGKTLGVIGLGKIGGLVAKLAGKGMRMRVLGYDPIISSDRAKQLGVMVKELDQIFAESDIITLHTPINSDTQDLINAQSLAAMKEGVIIVNCARSGIINDLDLLEALDSGKVGVAALDVFTTEPPDASDRLLNHPNVIATPHLAASTEEAQVNVAMDIARQIIDYLLNGAAHNAINVPAVSSGDRAKFMPYLDLAKRLGQFAAALSKKSVSDMEVEYRGAIADWNLEPINNSALMGLLMASEGSDINEVNAGFIAKDRGITFRQTTLKREGDYGSSLLVRITDHEGRMLSAQGALINRLGLEPRIIGIDNYITEATPAGHMLVVTNRDRPGMIAGMAGALAEKEVNIAQMNLSRDDVGGQALSIINLDGPAPQDAIDKILSIPGILTVTQMKLED
jgi:D-3-phosphoglycerate dehydrogenase